MEQYVDVDVYTKNGAKTGFPENTYRKQTPEQCLEIIRNCLRPIAGIAKIEVYPLKRVE